MSEGFLAQLTELLDQLQRNQDESFDAVADHMARTLQTGGLVHLFGSGHSVIPTMDAFPRYGAFVGLHPLTDPRLMWHNVLGPGGVRELLWLERTEGYVERFLQHESLAEGDGLIVFSHGGRNAAPIEAAQYGADRGLWTVAVTSVANTSRPAEHSSGKRLVDVADVVIDTGVPVEDALMSVDGWQRPVAGASTIVATAAMQELVARTAALLAAAGVTLPTFVSPTVPGTALSSNDAVFAEHARRLRKAAERSE